MSKFTSKIVQDTDPINPLKDNDNTGIYFVTAHRRYTFGELSFTDGERAKEQVEYLLSKGKSFEFPIYMYDHSGCTISMTPFSCPWDSGRIGSVIVNAKEFGNPDMDEATARKIALSMIEEVDQWLTGEVYGFQVLNEFGEIVDCCYGYFGKESAEVAAKEALDWHMNNAA